MVLDEPTNDLDLETLELLQERLADYTGTVLLVSHDRDFLDRVATSIIASEGANGSNGRWTEYAGGYSDMLAQRGPVRAPAPASAAARRSEAAAPAPRPPSRKLSFKDKHALETLPSRMAELEAEVSRLNAELGDPELYNRQPTRFAEATHALAAAQAALAAAEEQWLELEMLREAMEGA
jgi:ATP-binding cassette subfamily F protein uup